MLRMTLVSVIAIVCFIYRIMAMYRWTYALEDGDKFAFLRVALKGFNGFVIRSVAKKFKNKLEMAGTGRHSELEVKHLGERDLKALSVWLGKYVAHVFIALNWHYRSHYSDAIMSAMACPITSLTVVYSTVYSNTDQRKHQSSASLAFVRGIHRWPMHSPHKRPVTRKMFPFDDVIMPTVFICMYIYNTLLISRLASS